MSDDPDKDKDEGPEPGAGSEPKRSTSDAGLTGMHRAHRGEVVDPAQGPEAEVGQEPEDAPSQDQPTGPDDIRRLPPLPPQGSAEEERGPDDDQPPPNELTPGKIRELVENRNFIVGLIGYPTAGKTSFLNRLKFTYEHFRSEDRRRFDIWPSYDTGPVRQTAIPTYHYFTRVGGKPGREAASEESGLTHEDFVLFDLPGERFRIAFEEAGLAGERSEELNDAIAACDALILVLPSDLILGSRQAGADILRSQQETAENEQENLEDEIALLRREADAAAAGRAASAAAGKASREASIQTLRNRIVDLEAEPADAAVDAEIARLEDQLAEEERLAARADGNIARRNARETARINEELAPKVRRATELDMLIAALGARTASEVEIRQVGEAVAANRRKLDNFVARINQMVGKVALQKRLGKSAAEVEAMSDEERRAEIKKVSGGAYTPLIYVAVSKADEVLSPSSPVVPLRPITPLGQDVGQVEREDLDEHPAHVVKSCEPDIYRGITTIFPWFKFDFLTAFDGQRKTQYGYEPPAPLKSPAGNAGLRAAGLWRHPGGELARIREATGRRKQALRAWQGACGTMVGAADGAETRASGGDL